MGQQFAPVPLKTWIESNRPKDGTLWSSSLKAQVDFVLYDLSFILCRNEAEYMNSNPVSVVGTHRSKSIDCPVYRVDLAYAGLTVWMRNNFYNWCISVESKDPVTGTPRPFTQVDWLDSFDDETGYEYAFCEGMEQQKFGRFRDRQSRFTVSMASDFDAYTFFRALRRWAGITWSKER